MSETCGMCGQPRGMGYLEVHRPGEHLGSVIVCPKCQQYRDATYRLLDHLKPKGEHE